MCLLLLAIYSPTHPPTHRKREGKDAAWFDLRKEI